MTRSFVYNLVMVNSKFTATVYDAQGNELAYVRTPETAAAILGGIGYEGFKVKWRTYDLFAVDVEEVNATESILGAADIILRRWTDAQEKVRAKKQAKPRKSRKAKKEDES
jgi:hypothetical protein